MKRAGANLKNVEFFRFPTNRGWTRDFGPIFVKRAAPEPRVAIARFRFNAWAKYPDWKKDDAIPPQLAHKLKIDIFARAIRRTRLRPGRRQYRRERHWHRPHHRRVPARYESPGPQSRGSRAPKSKPPLKQNLGVTNVVWLGKGIAGDDTHGHVDDLCRFVDARRAVLIREKKSHDAILPPP